jgi:hypothetical protein
VSLGRRDPCRPILLGILNVGVVDQLVEVLVEQYEDPTAWLEGLIT